MKISVDMPMTVNNMPFSPVFARHETFHPRYGWLKKGYDAILEDAEVFSKEDAPTILGVGKNMVKSIRYWGLAFKIFDVATDSSKRQTAFATTELGERLLDNKGWDPYLEDPATLWLLHWELMKQPCKATAWWFAFNEFHHISFTQDDLFLALRSFINRKFLKYSIKDSSLKKDISCILRMYIPRSDSEKQKEETINSPFAKLMLFKNYGDSKHFSFNIEKKHNLPAELIVATCLDHAHATTENVSTISVSRLLHEHNSPGLIFKLSEASLCEAVEQVARNFEEISIAESAGLLQFHYNGNPKEIAYKILDGYYK